ncbi:hypothetical protein I352_05011 [Cryptococcus deuterogattii MMRL2647]|nr:hypothetical protein I352_05011 [Cryptococcus deuterogattii MMRL2647]
MSNPAEQQQGGRITKAAFFRARSPPILPPSGLSSKLTQQEDQDNGGTSLFARFDAATRLNPPSAPLSSEGAYPDERSRYEGSNVTIEDRAKEPRYEEMRDNHTGTSNTLGNNANFKLPIRNSMYSTTPATDGHGSILDRPIAHPVNPAAYVPTSEAYSESSQNSLQHQLSQRQQQYQQDSQSQKPNYHTRQSSRSRSIRSTHPRLQSLSVSSHATPQTPGTAVLSNHSNVNGNGSSQMDSPHDTDSGYGESMETYDSNRGMRRSPSIKDNASMSIGDGSDEMLLTLLAGQAVVDAQGMGIGGWEEVEGWKKELSLLSSRLESVQARHQREIKILTAARALQKLNGSNKRMSKQTMESLEQSEKKVEAAEKDLLVLRDREASLRRRLLEHYSSVMSWEVRRLTRITTEIQSRLDSQSYKLSTFDQREQELIRQVDEGRAKVEELETMVLELGRREKGIEEEARELEAQRDDLERERATWAHEREQLLNERQIWLEHSRGWDKQVAEFNQARHNWAQEREALLEERERLTQNGQTSEDDRQIKDHVCTVLGSLLGQKGQSIREEEIVPALEDLKKRLAARETEVLSLREDVREVNMGLEEEVRRVADDRDAWKAKLEKGEALRKEEVTSLERSLRQQQDQITDLTLRNESLSASLATAQKNLTGLSSPSTPQTTDQRIQTLTTELQEIASQFASIWPLLPPRLLREKADLIDPRTGSPNRALASPSCNINIEALQELYRPRQGEPVGSIAEALERIKGLVQDGKLLVDRIVRMGKEREILKTNAAKAKKLVEDSTRNLETYQQQVAILEDSLAKSSQSESNFLNELNSLQNSLDKTTQAKRSLEN